MNTSNPKVVRRGRPPRSGQQAEKGREVIIGSARKLFAEEGYHGVSMRKIASLAQCSPASLYKLFPNKRQLLLHIWEEVFVRLMDDLKVSYQNSPPAGRLEAMCLSFIDFWLSRPDDYRAIFLVEDRPQSVDEHYFVESSVVLQCLSLFRTALVEAQERGELGKGDTDEKQSVLLCGMQGVVMNLITVPEYPWGEPDVIKKATIRALMAGM